MTNYRIMVQRWIKNIVVFTAATIFFAACTPKEYSKDEPLEDTYSASVYISSQNQILYALNPKTGVKLWEINIGTNLASTPLILGEKLILGTDKGLMIIDAKKGTSIATVSSVISTQSSPTGEGNFVYIGTDDNKIVAVDLNNDNAISWSFNTSGPVNSSPMIYDGRIYCAAGNDVYSIDQAAGTQLWQYPASGGAGFFASPTIEPPYLYIGNNNGTLYAIDAKQGTLGWQYDTKGPIRSSPIVYGGNIIFGSDDNNLYCIDSAARKERWIFKTTERIVSSPYGYNNVIYFGGFDHTFYAVNVIDGELKWRYNTTGLIKSSPLAYEGVVYIGSYDKNLYAFDTSGALKWSNNIDGAIETSPVIYDLEKSYYPAVSGKSVD